MTQLHYDIIYFLVEKMFISIIGSDCDFSFEQENLYI